MRCRTTIDGGCGRVRKLCAGSGDDRCRHGCAYRVFGRIISRFELLSGARNSRQQNSIRQLLAAVPALELDDEAADKAAEMRRSLDRSGASIGMADSLIAGIVLVHSAVLLTRNRRHFERVPELRLADRK